MSSIDLRNAAAVLRELAEDAKGVTDTSVALALADWLDAEVRECDQMVTRRHERDGVPVRDVEREVFAGHPALAVASAILKARA